MIDRIEETTDKAASVEASEPAVVKRPRKPSAPLANKPRKSLAPLTIEERFAQGNFRIKEAAAFCGCSISSINKYLKDGLLPRVKCGGCTCIPGPALARFMRGE